MELSKINPWNWFKHEEPNASEQAVPVKREQYPSQTGVADIWQLHREMDRLFDEAFRGFGLLTRRLNALFSDNNQAAFRPNLNVASDDKQYTVSLEAPGLVQEDIKLELNGQTLFIQGEKHLEKEDKDQHYYRIERSYGQFQRTLDLPDDVVLEKIEASMKNGVLTVILPRDGQAPKNGHRQIPIKS